MITIKEAKRHVLDNRDAGVWCPCCGIYCQVYTFHFTANMAYSLMWLVKRRREGPEGEWVHVSDEGPRGSLKSRCEGKLEHWGVVERASKELCPSRKRWSGLWRATAKGQHVADRIVRVPKFVRLYRNKVLEWSPETVDIKDALGTEFDYQKLING